MTQKILESISIGVVGNVKGFRYVGETLEDAANRNVLAAEMHGNNGHSRIHIDIKKEVEPEPGQSRLAATLARALTRPSYAVVSESRQGQMAHIIDGELAQIRDAFAELKPCPIITHHPEGPCVFCAGYALRDVLLLKEINVTR